MEEFHKTSFKMNSASTEKTSKSDS